LSRKKLNISIFEPGTRRNVIVSIAWQEVRVGELIPKITLKEYLLQGHHSLRSINEKYDIHGNPRAWLLKTDQSISLFLKKAGKI